MMFYSCQFSSQFQCIFAFLFYFMPNINIIFMNQQQKRQRAKSETRLKKLQKIGFKHQVIKLRKDYNNSNRFQQLKHHEKSKSLKDIAKKQLNKNSGGFLDPTKIISVSAPKWVIYDYFSSKYVRGYRAHDLNELSVFSKLLVFCTINTLVAKNKIDTSRFQTIVTPSVVRMYRNSKLKVDDILTLQHLIHLLLMDEGEQYELIAALNIGAYLQKKRKKQYYSVYDADEKMFKTHLAQFYDLVNSYCQTMKMENIKYVQPDPNKKKQVNKCSASDVATLSAQCLKIPYFRQILKLTHKTVEIKYINNEGALQTRVLQLKNKTVDNPFISYFNICRNWEEGQFMNSNGSVFYQALGVQPIVVVLLGSYGPLDRQKDIQQIIQWYLKNYKRQQEKQQKKQSLKMKPANEVQKKQKREMMGGEMRSIEEVQQDDPESTISLKKKNQNRLKTQNTKELDNLLEQKLRGFDSKGFKIRERKSTKRILTEA